MSTWHEIHGCFFLVYHGGLREGRGIDLKSDPANPNSFGASATTFFELRRPSLSLFSCFFLFFFSFFFKRTSASSALFR